MPHRTIMVATAGFTVAFGLPMYYFALKKRAAASLGKLLAERFSERAPPLAQVEVPSGGRIRFHSAYWDNSGSGLLLVLGNWTFKFSRGGAYLKVAGLFKPDGDSAWLDRIRRRRGIIVATTVPGGALFAWKGLPSRKSVLAYLDAAH